MRAKPIKILTAVIFAVLAVGCSIEPETLESLRNAVNTVSAQASPTAQISTEETAGLAFNPPHPGRVDPFSFPADAPIADHAGTTITSVAQIEVLGFAHVDEPRVFLRTKDLTKSLKTGDIVDGVEVISINAPTVELRMGSLVWTASMFDNASVARN